LREMEKRRLGSTDLYLSVVGLGSGPFAGGFGDITVDKARDSVKKSTGSRH